MNDKKIIIFDTTLRDGEQSPGASMTPSDKVRFAMQLEALNVDIIEAGFAISSPIQSEGIKMICDAVRTPVIASLARAVDKDIDAAAMALENAAKKRIHIVLATSPVHREYKLKKTCDEVIKMAVRSVQYARQFAEDIEFSAEDASRTEPGYLCEVMEAVIEAGASTVNIPDTVGYAIPGEFINTIASICKNIGNTGKAVISTHCHNDLGLAVANSLAAIEAGASQIEVSVNGIGERAGNASLEEIAMALHVRRDWFNAYTGININEIYKTSRLLTSITGIQVQPNKAIVGKNAFSHESGIHQDGFLKERTTYEIMKPESIGRSGSEIVLGRHSGRHGVMARLKNLGFNLNDAELDRVFDIFSEIADRKKAVYDDELMAIIRENTGAIVPESYSLIKFQIMTGNGIIPIAVVEVSRGTVIMRESSAGNGPVDAIFKAIDRITNISAELEDYSVSSIASGNDAMGEVNLSISVKGREYCGHASATDTLEAGARAYLNAINKTLKY